MEEGMERTYIVIRVLSRRQVSIRYPSHCPEMVKGNSLHCELSQ